MLIFGHLGPTLAASRLGKRWNPSFAFVAFGSLLPDMIDKPLGLVIFGTMAMGRTIAHTLLFLTLLVLFAFILRSRNIASLSGGILGHLAEDFMWKTPVVFFWPFLGSFPLHSNIGILSYIEALIMALGDPIVLIPECFGLFYVAYVGSKLKPGIKAKCKVLRNYNAAEN